MFAEMAVEGVLDHRIYRVNKVNVYWHANLESARIKMTSNILTLSQVSWWLTAGRQTHFEQGPDWENQKVKAEKNKPFKKM